MNSNLNVGGNIIIGSGTSAIQLISIKKNASDDTRIAHFGSKIPVQIDRVRVFLHNK